ncbi:hypothetical protein [Companilactobacillus jidongensis]|uniref:hypothetical protein n=1 Tax=Companilactobacillus jidongensis TaxID=2486006 RepID=UPI0013DE1B63|nr:hypothetical protein [Companilactobacillus jidongensis]
MLKINIYVKAIGILLIVILLSSIFITGWSSYILLFSTLSVAYGIFVQIHFKK